jgi:formamidopyrimidine-DNA glycosylase
MPELPEVETVVSALAPVVTGLEVTDVRSEVGVRWEPSRLTAGLILGTPYRRGKWIIIPAGDKELVVHLGMTGALLVGTEPVALQRPTRVLWTLQNVSGQLTYMRYDDVRGFGRTAVVAPGQYETLPGLDSLGPEPLDSDLDVEAVAKAISESNAPVKAVLLGQKAVAGVGNIYADEALFSAGIHPAARRLDQASAEKLITAVVGALASGVEHGGTTLRDYKTPDGASGSHQHHLVCYGRSGQPCERCGTILERLKVAGRGTTFCPRCQPAR